MTNPPEGHDPSRTPGRPPSPWDPPPGPEPVLATTRFRVTAADVTAAWRANLRWRYTRPGAIALPVLLGLAVTAVDAALHPDASLVLLAVPLLGLPLLVVAGRLCRYALLVPLLARRTYRQTRAYHEEWSVELTQSGSRARTSDYEHFVPWKHYVAWSETDRVILLYHSDAMFQFVPRPAVDTEAMRVFRTLVAGLKKR